jgi:DNA primase catalytic core
MPRIPDDVIARLKREVDLKALVERAGVALTRRGKEWVGLCCFHSEATASLSVNPEKGSWHCFSCGRGGSVLDFVMAKEGVDFRAAVERLAAEFLPGVELEPAPEPLLERAEAERLAELPLPELLAWVAGYYHERAKREEKARAYLASRGLAHPELLDAWQIGYSDRSLGQILPSKQVKAGAALRARLQELGIFRESGHEHLNGRVVLPTRTLAGEVGGLYGRALTPNLRTGTPDHLYLPGPRRGLFNLAGLTGSTEVILCEAPLDALTFWCAGFRNVTSTYGAGGFTAEMREALLGHGIERVLLAFDADKEGDAGAEAVAKQLGADGIGCWRVRFPRDMDANLYARKVSPAAQSLDLVLRQAEWMGRGPAPAALVPADFAGAATPAATVEAALETAAEEGAAASSSVAEPPVAVLEALGDQAPAAPAPLATGATLLPATPRVDVPCEVTGESVVITLGDRRFRIRGLAKNLAYDTLKVNVLAARGEAFHADTLDLCSARQRSAFAKQAAVELSVREETLFHDLGRVYLKLEELQDQAIKKELEPKEAVPTMSPADREAALGLLRDPRLLERIVLDLEKVGIVGEAVNKLLCYLVTISSLLAKPLGVLIQSSSAAGKSALMRAVLELVPAERRVAYSAMTSQSLFYMAGKDLRHKVLAIAEEEGAEKASYALKLLMSEGELSIASTGKDPASGRLVTHEYQVEGPIAVLSTTTSIEIDEELANRCIILTVDEDREQTRAIHAAQRKSQTIAGQLARRRRPAVAKLHQNAQRLLRPLMVGLPFAEELTYPDSASRTRRDHEKYLDLIRAIALLHQYQREVKTTLEEGELVEYIDAMPADVAIANALARAVLGRSLDELPPQTRRLLMAIDCLVRQQSAELAIPRPDVRLSRRDIRAFTGWGQSQLAVHLARLESLEYLIVHRGSRGQTYVYELAYEAQPGAERVVLAGLLDAEALGYSGNLPGFLTHLPGLVVEFPGSFRPPSGGFPGGFRGEETPAKPGVVHRFDGRFAQKRIYGSRRIRPRRNVPKAPGTS